VDIPRRRSRVDVWRRPRSKPVQLHEATVNGPATAVQTFEGWSAHQDQSNGQTEHRVVANATGPAGGEVAVGLPVAPGKEITFRARHGTLLRARAIDDGELLLEHRVGRVRMVAEAPADAHAHAFGLDDSDEWRSNLPPPKPLAKPPSSAPGAKKPPRVAPVKPGKLKEDHRFQVAFLNHLPVPLDLYYYAPKEGTETLQSRAAPFETLQIVTYWRAHFVVRDPVSGLRAAQLAIPVMPIRDCGKEKADAFAARYLRDAVAVGIHAPDDVNATGADSIGVSSLAEQLVVAEDASK